MAEFRKLFEALAAPLSRMSKEVLEGMFINGLKLEILVEVWLLCANGLAQLMEMAQRIEDRNLITQPMKKNPAYNVKMGFNPNRMEGKRGEAFLMRLVMVEEQLTAPKREYTTRLMTDTELKLRREKGLCFQCDEEYTYGHQCKNRELRILLVQQEEEGDGKGEEPLAKEQLEIVAKKVELSLNSMVGLATPRIINLKGGVGE